MFISIDGNCVEESQVQGQNLESILAHVQDHHLPPNRMLGEVILNGQSYSEDIPHAAVEVERTEINRLELITRSSEEIALHFLQNGATILESLLSALPAIIEIFRLGDETEANEHYLRFLDALHLLVGMLDHATKIMDIPLKQQIKEYGSLDNRLRKLAEMVTQLLKIQQETDWIYLADILEYELTPELEMLRDIMPHLRGTAH